MRYLAFLFAFLAYGQNFDSIQRVAANSAVVPRLFFGTAAPGSVTGNLPGDLYSDTTNHNVYQCNATSGTAAPACTSVTAGGWALLNGGGGLASITVQSNGTPVSTTATTLNFAPSGDVCIPSGSTVVSIVCAPDSSTYPKFTDMQAWTSNSATATSGSATAYVAAYVPPIAAYADKMVLELVIDTNCTGSMPTTFNAGGGAKRIYESDGATDPTSSYCTLGKHLLVAYDPTLTGAAGGWRIIAGGL